MEFRLNETAEHSLFPPRSLTAITRSVTEFHPGDEVLCAIIRVHHDRLLNQCSFGATLGTMRNGYSAAQIREAEAPFLARGVPLMIRAAQSLAEHTTSILPEPDKARVLVLAGPGSNGGDAVYAASFIANAGVKVQVVAVAGRLHEAAEAAARHEGAEIILDASPESAAELAIGADVILDGVLGIGSGGTAAGASPGLRDPARAFVVAVKSAIESAPDPTPIVIAVDMPSGIDPDDGSVPDPDAVIKAQLTITFIGIKAGLLLEPAASLAGKVWLEPLGASQGLIGVRPEVLLP